MVSNRSKEVKTLGRSDNDGGYIVELSHTEYKTLAALSEALNGSCINWLGSYPDTKQVNLDEAFLAVREYVITLDIVNQMQGRLDQMKELLQANGVKDEPGYEQLYNEARSRLG